MEKKNTQPKSNIKNPQNQTQKILNKQAADIQDVIPS